jgi:hypothetical protein
LTWGYALLNSVVVLVPFTLLGALIEFGCMIKGEALFNTRLTLICES